MTGTKRERTAARIREVAFEALRTDGWRDTTMRGIAERAGVAPGTIYTSMPSKEHLLVALYDEAVARIDERATPLLEGVRPFAARMRVVLGAMLDEIGPYHRVATETLGQAISIDAPTSPFGPASAPARERMTALLTRVVEDSDLVADRQLRAALPELLWTLVMAGMLAWASDRSTDQRRSRALVDQAVPMLDRALRITAVPLLRSQVRDLLALAEAARELADPDEERP
ncbi:TetR family transcriptional regulator [Agrococcus sp. SL85]|uniref:TetR family transcriptional regulator n=1 Tax=Agrococcus sp. SL85 TaxID=2995141 RepID=UPI00226C99B6|nr:TetR family transcriptional regulator [Agrococcus sp. SL85]WAC66134.1 TetR family transcriptional regulator [Agrococcus sp. SL85]